MLRSRYLLINPSRHFASLEKARNLALPGEYELSAAYISRRRREFAYAREQLEAADSLLPERNFTSRARLLREQGDWFRQRGKPDSALVYLDQAIAAYERVFPKIHPNLAYCFLSRGLCLRQSGRYEDAISSLEESILRARQSLGEDHIELAKAYGQLGNCWFFLRDYAQALAYQQKALFLFQKHLGDEHRMVAQTHNDLALNYSNLDQGTAAIDHYQKALEIYRKQYPENHRSILRTLINMGIGYQINGQHLIAEGLYRKVLQARLKQENPIPQAVSRAYTNLGRSLFRQDRFEEAIEAFRAALQYGRKSWGEWHPQLCYLPNNLAECWMGLGNNDSALQAVQNAIRHQLPKQLTPLEILPPLMEVARPDMLLNSLRFRARILKETQLEESLNTWLLAISLQDSLQIYFETEHTRLNLNRDAQLAYEAALELIWKLNNEEQHSHWIGKAFELIEKSKSPVLRAALNEKEARDLIPPGFQQRDRLLREEMSDIKKQLFDLKLAGAKQKNEILELEASWLDKRRQRDSLIQVIKQEFPAWHAIRYGQEFVSVKSIQQKLSAKDLTILEYFWGEESRFLMLLTGDQMRFVKLDIPNEEEKELQTFLSSLRDRNLSVEGGKEARNTLRTASRKWHQLLIGPVKDLLAEADSSWLIIPDGPLSYLPFDVLLEDDRAANSYYDFPWLGKRVAIFYNHSLQIWDEETHSFSGKGLAAFAPSYGQGDYLAVRDAVPLSQTDRSEIAPLFYNQKEAVDISEIWRGNLYKGTEATEYSFRQIAPENRSCIWPCMPGLKTGIPYIPVYCSQNQRQVQGRMDFCIPMKSTIRHFRPNW